MSRNTGDNRARQEGRTPEEISGFYHQEFVRVFDKLGFSYDLYTKTTDKAHKEFVTEFHRKLYDSEFVYEKTSPEAYCEQCGKVLTDRLVIGLCPICNKETRSDQCDNCGTVLEPHTVIDPVCSECGANVVFYATKQLYLAISKLEKHLSDYLLSNHIGERMPMPSPKDIWMKD